MKSLKDGIGYNERLFAGGFRSRLHGARFSWFATELAKKKYTVTNLLELGCFDGKLLDFLPNKPSRYVGFDANWEGGLDIAKKKWAGAQNYLFFQACTAQEMNFKDSDIFNVAVAMETLEHVPPELVDEYLQEIARHLNGHFFVTVPNEKGIVFLAKWVIKKLISNDAQHYTLPEVINATLGRAHLVTRHEHKGFDYQALVKNIEKHFDIVDVSGHPCGFLPTSLCFGVGIIAKSKQ